MQNFFLSFQNWKLILIVALICNFLFQEVQHRVTAPQPQSKWKYFWRPVPVTPLCVCLEAVTPADGCCFLLCPCNFTSPGLMASSVVSTLQRRAGILHSLSTPIISYRPKSYTGTYSVKNLKSSPFYILLSLLPSLSSPSVTFSFLSPFTFLFLRPVSPFLVASPLPSLSVSLTCLPLSSSYRSQHPPWLSPLPHTHTRSKGTSLVYADRWRCEASDSLA